MDRRVLLKTCKNHYSIDSEPPTNIGLFPQGSTYSKFVQITRHERIVLTGDFREAFLSMTGSIWKPFVGWTVLPDDQMLQFKHCFNWKGRLLQLEDSCFRFVAVATCLPTVGMSLCGCSFISRLLASACWTKAAGSATSTTFWSA